MKKYRILRIGIASREAVRKRTIAIARGEIRPGDDEPRVWFSSLLSLGRLLTEDNMLLLETIRNSNPKSISELAELSGRAKSNVSRTLHNMERYGIVELKEIDKGRKAPVLNYESIDLDLPLGMVA